MEFQDERTKEEMKTHCFLYGGTDKFMSGWGKASGGKSYAFWAFKPEDESKVLSWIHSRKEIIRQRHVVSSYKPKGKGHCHVYVIRGNHPALS